MSSPCSSSTTSVPPPPIPSNTDSETLIPGLPNDLSTQILSMIPYSHNSRLKPTSKSWQTLLSSKSLLTLRQTHPSHLLCIFPQDPSISPPYLFDPTTLAWRSLPPLPCNPHAYGLSNFISISHYHSLYVIGGSLFDTRSFPIDIPIPSSSIFHLDLSTFSWEDSLSPMITPRGSFACAVDASGRILVAGGGSRHAMFEAAGSRLSAVEMYDVEKDKWVELVGLPALRAGCVGFLLGDEFWVMGGYGPARTVSGLVPIDDYYRDGVVLELRNGCKWREIGDMWEQGERRRLGSVVVVNGENGDVPSVFMLDASRLFRYDISLNRWLKESTVPKKSHLNSSFGFVALNGELHVLSQLTSVDSVEGRQSRQYKRGATLLIQIYHPKKKAWRSLTTRPPFHCYLDFKTAVMCTVRI